MTPERWKKLDALFHEALELQGEARAAHLAMVCGDDRQLREEAVRLIAAHEKEGSFIDSPILRQTAEPTGDGHGESPVGRRVGPYQVISLLGRGGMGEVFLAQDARLERKVALKVLPAAFTQNPDCALRFEREAKAASALNHPNILTIYEIGEADGAHYIVSEFVKGETLRALIERGSLNTCCHRATRPRPKPAPGDCSNWPLITKRENTSPSRAGCWPKQPRRAATCPESKPS